MDSAAVLLTSDKRDCEMAPAHASSGAGPGRARGKGDSPRQEDPKDAALRCHREEAARLRQLLLSAGQPAEGQRDAAERLREELALGAAEAERGRREEAELRERRVVVSSADGLLAGGSEMQLRGCARSWRWGRRRRSGGGARRRSCGSGGGQRDAAERLREELALGAAEAERGRREEAELRERRVVVSSADGLLAGGSEMQLRGCARSWRWGRRRRSGGGARRRGQRDAAERLREELALGAAEAERGRREEAELRERTALTEATLRCGGARGVAELSAERQRQLEGLQQELARLQQERAAALQRAGQLQELRRKAGDRARHLAALRHEGQELRRQARCLAAGRDPLLAGLDSGLARVRRDLARKCLVLQALARPDELDALSARASHDDEARRWRLASPGSRRPPARDPRFARDVILQLPDCGPVSPPALTLPSYLR
ncbi:leucine zipper putative tumor suppressor 2-like [Bacillus rossius redtenbacheri]|uniref:leucine zipper putative tumor suppressor 2-like n=1 Tax=Bacillus rossius redtenbacheri TaxID=93214 RepID=UPI002FDD46D6